MNHLLALFEDWKVVGKATFPLEYQFCFWGRSGPMQSSAVSVFLYEKPRSKVRKWVVVASDDIKEYVQEKLEPFLYDWKMNNGKIPSKISFKGNL